MDLFDLVVKLSIDDDNFNKGLTDVENKISSMKSVIAGVGAATAAIAGTVAAVKAVGDAVVQGTAELAQYGDSVDKMSQKMGMSVEAFQEWDAVMQHSGTSMETLKASMRTLANAAETDNEAFQKLGITQEQIASMSQEELFSATITALQNVTDETERTYLAGKLLGRGSAELGALLNTSAEETQKMKDRVHELGGVLSDEVVKASAQFQDNLQDMNTAIDGVKRSIQAEFLPALNLLMEGFTSLIANEEGAEEKLVEGFEKLVDGFEGAVNKLEPIAKTLIPRIVEFAVKSLPDIANLSIDIVDTLVDTILDNVDELLTAATQIIYSLSDGLSRMSPELIPAVTNIVFEIVNTLLDNQDQLIEAAEQIIIALADGLSKAIPILIEKAPEIIIKLATALVESIYKIDEVPPKIIKEIADGLVHTDWTETAEAMMDGLISSLDVAQKKVKFWIDGARKALTGESLYDGDFNNVTSSDFINTMETGKDIVVDAIGEAADAVEKSYDAFYGTVNDGNDKVADAAGQMPDAYSKITGEMSDYAKSLETQAKQWKSSVSKATDEVVEDEKTLKAKLQAAFRDFESEMYENGFTQEWLVHKEREYVEALDHSTELYKDYNNKLLKEEEKITKAADKEYEKQLTESNKRKKTALEKAFANFEKIALEQGFTEEWLVNQERAYLEALDHNTELYEEYNMKLLRAENKLSTETENQRKKYAEQTKKSFTSMVDNMVNSAKDKIKEYEKVVEDIKSKIKTFADKLTTSYKDMFEFTVDEKTGKMSAKKTQDFLTDRVHQLEAYYDNIQKLKEKGISDSMLKQLSGMSAEEGAAVAEYWMKLDDKELGKLDRVWSRYEKTGQKVSEELYSEELENAEQKLDSERNTLLGEIQKTVDDKLNEVVGAIATTNSTGQQIFNDLNDLLTNLNDEIENTFGKGFAVTLDSKQVVGAILPQVDNGLGRRTRAAMRGGA